MSLWARCPRCGEIVDLSVHKCTSQEQPKNNASVAGKSEKTKKISQADKEGQASERSAFQS